MTAAIAEIAQGHDLPGLPDRPISIEEYHDLAATGVLEDGAPYELLEGWVVQKMTRGPEHDSVVVRLLKRLGSIIPDGWHLRPQCGLTAEGSEPEPDWVVVRGDESEYDERHPDPHETGLVVEVARSSVRRDRGWKRRIYARGGVPVYWIVNLVSRTVEVYREPTPAGPDGEPTYLRRVDVREGEEVAVEIAGREVGRVRVSDLLPKPARR